jgi:hypothetical protein
MADHVEPCRGLRACAEQTSRRKQPRKGEGVHKRNRRGEQISAGEQQERAGTQNRELRKQQHRSDEVVDRQRRLIACDESGHLRQRNVGIGYDEREQQRRQADDHHCRNAIAACGRQSGQENVGVASRRNFRLLPPSGSTVLFVVARQGSENLDQTALEP